jgi:hypothetical protein
MHQSNLNTNSLGANVGYVAAVGLVRSKFNLLPDVEVRMVC